MNHIHYILTALSDRAIARNVTIPHDEARMAFPLHSNTVQTFAEFSELIGAYYNHHFTACISGGARLSPSDAKGGAKEAIERTQRRGRDIVSVFNDACDGTNGGMRAVLDMIADHLKEEGVRRYIRDVFETSVSPAEWAEKVEIIRQFIDQCGVNLSASVVRHQPERYAHDYQPLIQAYVEGLREAGERFRRL